MKLLVKLRSGYSLEVRLTQATVIGQQQLNVLEKGEQRYPNSKLAPQFKLDLAYAYYKFSQDAEAIAMLDKFIRLYPNHPTVDYAFYLKGVVLFVDRGLMDKFTLQDISDRDIAPLKKASKPLKLLLSDILIVNTMMIV